MPTNSLATYGTLISNLHYITLHYITLHYITLHYDFLAFLVGVDLQCVADCVQTGASAVQTLTGKSGADNGEHSSTSGFTVPRIRLLILPRIVGRQTRS